MTKKCRVATLFIIAMLVPGPRALTQDSLSVVILSPRIGAVIDANEREYFHVFSQFEPLDSAVVLKSIGGRYYVHIMKTAKEGLPADITFAYTEVVLARMAEKIDHLEALEHGTYHMGDHPPALQTAGIQLISERARALSPPTSAAAMFASVDSTKRSPAWGVSSDNQVRSGRTITIVTASDNTMTGVLLSVRPGEILLSERGGVEETALAGHPEWIIRLPISDIASVHGDGHSNAPLGGIIGLGIGIAAGISDKEDIMKNGNIIEQTLSPMIVFWDAVGGLVFGALIGAFIHTGGEDLDRPQADVLMKLKCESRYPQEEPEFLKMLK